MPSDARKDGYALGSLGAHVDAVEIRAAKSSVALGKLAGHRLDVWKRNNKENWWVRSGNTQFDEGFWEGFVDRAEFLGSRGGGHVP